MCGTEIKTLDWLLTGQSALIVRESGALLLYPGEHGALKLTEDVT